MKEIYEKLYEFRKLTGKVVKSKDNPFLKSRYADLNSVIEATDPALEQVGLLYIDRIDGQTLVSEIIDPESGQIISATTLLVLVKNDMQALGSAITYARRYARISILGLQAIDEDGNTASGKIFAKPAQIKKITDLALATGTDMQRFLSYYHVSQVKDMYEDTANDAIKTLQIKKEKMGDKK